MQVYFVLKSMVFPLPFKDLRWNFIFFPLWNAIMKDRGSLEQIMWSRKYKNDLFLGEKCSNTVA